MSNDIRIVETTKEIPQYKLSPRTDIFGIVFWAFVGGVLFSYGSANAMNLHGSGLRSVVSVMTGAITLIALMMSSMAYYELKFNQVSVETKTERFEQPEYTPPLFHSSANGDRLTFTKWMISRSGMAFIAKECTEHRPLTRQMIMSASNAHNRVHGKPLLSNITRAWQSGDIQREMKKEGMISESGIPTEKLLTYASPAPLARNVSFVIDTLGRRDDDGGRR